jgi:cardiolipin synthase
MAEHGGGEQAAPGEVDTLWTVPNLFTLVRLLCRPLFLWLLFGLPSRQAAAWLLGALGATDWVDGYVARRFNQTSTFGKMYDPTVDRLMMVVGIISIIVDGSVPLWFALVILIREVLVAGWVLTTVALGAKRMNVTWWGKVGTFANMCAFPWFLFSHEATFSDGVQTLWKVLAYCAVVPGVTFSLLAAGQYVTLGRRAIAEGRAERAAAERAGDPR